MITAEDIRRLLRYDAHTGLFIWLVDIGRKTKAGSAAGWREPDGYYRVGFNGRAYKAHRLAWLYVHGEWPKQQIDHIDGNKSNNAISNLREASHSQNNWNKTKKRNNASGFKGVHWHSRDKTWRAEIRSGGVRHHLGSFSSADQAAAAYAAASKVLHGDYSKI